MLLLLLLLLLAAAAAAGCPTKEKVNAPCATLAGHPKTSVTSVPSVPSAEQPAASHLAVEVASHLAVEVASLPAVAALHAEAASHPAVRQGLRLAWPPNPSGSVHSVSLQPEHTPQTPKTQESLEFVAKRQDASKMFMLARCTK